MNFVYSMISMFAAIGIFFLGHWLWSELTHLRQWVQAVNLRLEAPSTYELQGQIRNIQSKMSDMRIANVQNHMSLEPRTEKLEARIADLEARMKKNDEWDQYMTKRLADLESRFVAQRARLDQMEFTLQGLRGKF